MRTSEKIRERALPPLQRPVAEGADREDGIASGGEELRVLDHETAEPLLRERGELPLHRLGEAGLRERGEILVAHDDLQARDERVALRGVASLELATVPRLHAARGGAEPVLCVAAGGRGVEGLGTSGPDGRVQEGRLLAPHERERGVDAGGRLVGRAGVVIVERPLDRRGLGAPARGRLRVHEVVVAIRLDGDWRREAERVRARQPVRRERREEDPCRGRDPDDERESHHAAEPVDAPRRA